MIRWLFAFCLCLSVLHGCAATRPSVDLPDITNWERRQSVLGELSSWEFRGRIAVKAGDSGFNGKIKWLQHGDDFVSTVGGPLGIGTVRIETIDRTVMLTDKDGFDTVLVEPEAELFSRYGWSIPVTSLRYWALGIPDPASEAVIRVDDAGHLVSLEQGDWAVSISRYQESAGQQMPRTVMATSLDTRVRIVIDNWKFFE